MTKKQPYANLTSSHLKIVLKALLIEQGGHCAWLCTLFFLLSLGIQSYPSPKPRVVVVCLGNCYISYLNAPCYVVFPCPVGSVIYIACALAYCGKSLHEHESMDDR
jgi:hypothetical protein